MNDVFLTVGAQTAVVAVLVALVALVGGQKLRFFPLVLAAAVFAAYVFALFNGDVLFERPELAELKVLFAGSKWNWAGKIVSFASTLVMAAVVALMVRDDQARMGFTLRQNPGSVLPAIAMAVAVIGASVAIEITVQDGTDLSADRMLYQAIAPGFDEEPMFRGLLLYLLTVGLGGNERRFAGIGVGGLLTTVLFGLGHGLAFDGGAMIFAPVPIAVTGAIGLCLLWIRERTGSLVLPILVHNAINLANGFF